MTRIVNTGIVTAKHTIKHDRNIGINKILGKKMTLLTIIIEIHASAVLSGTHCNSKNVEYLGYF